MKWTWGEKKQEKTSLNFAAELDQTSVIRTKVKVHYELDIEYPAKENIAQVLRDIKYEMKLPTGVTIHEGEILHVEVYQG
tara:strand:- start:882 stop:1121 length:240 start_codon:yes stop_codon:yes gene_type:complete